MEFYINRDSVCLGDDINDHNIEFDIKDTVSIRKFIRTLIKSKFFPNIYGNDVVWVMVLNGIEYASYMTKRDKIVLRYILGEHKIKDVIQPGDQVIFNYYSPIEKRAKYLFTKYEGSLKNIKEAGLKKEYKLYKIKTSTQAMWLEEEKTK